MHEIPKGLMCMAMVIDKDRTYSLLMDSFYFLCRVLFTNQMFLFYFSPKQNNKETQCIMLFEFSLLWLIYIFINLSFLIKKGSYSIL